MSTTVNRVVKNTGFLYAKMGITMFISLWTTRLILNSLGASDFGIFNIVGGAIAMLGFLNAAMAGATQRFMSYAEGAGDKEKEKSIFNVSIVLHFFLALIIGVLLVIAGFVFFNGVLNIPQNRVGAAEVVYGSLIISTVFTIMTVPYDAAMNAHENMKFYAIVGILESILKLIVAFITVYTLSDKLIVYGILMAIIPLITLSIMRIYCHHHYEECTFSLKRYWDKSMMIEMTKFAGWNFFSSFSGIVGNYGNGIVLNHFWGTILNAASGIANQLSGQLCSLSQNLIKAVNPVIVKSEGDGSSESMLKYMFAACKYSYLLILVLAIPFSFEAPLILRLWLKNIPEWGIFFFVFQMSRNLIEQLYIPLETAIGAKGNIRGISLSSLFCNLMQIPVICVISYYGGGLIWYFIVIFSIMVFIKGIVIVYFCNKICKMLYSDYFRKVFFPCCMMTASMIFSDYIVINIMTESFMRIIVSGIVTTSTLLLVFYLLSSDIERQYLRKVVQKIQNSI